MSVKISEYVTLDKSDIMKLVTALREGDMYNFIDTAAGLDLATIDFDKVLLQLLDKHGIGYESLHALRLRAKHDLNSVKKRSSKSRAAAAVGIYEHIVKAEKTMDVLEDSDSNDFEWPISTFMQEFRDVVISGDYVSLSDFLLDKRFGKHNLNKRIQKLAKIFALQKSKQVLNLGKFVDALTSAVEQHKEEITLGRINPKSATALSDARKILNSVRYIKRQISE